MMRAKLALAAALGLFAQPAGAQITVNGTVPVGHSGQVIIQPNNEAATGGVIKFKFSAPTRGAYTLGFCIGPASNPCGLSTSYVVNVPGGQEMLAIVDASIFKDNELVVVQGTGDPLPFSVTLE